MSVTGHCTACGDALWEADHSLFTGHPVARREADAA